MMARLWAYDWEANFIDTRINSALLTDNKEELVLLMPLIRILNAYVDKNPVKAKVCLYRCGSYPLNQVCVS